jgi:hypothetical protein
LYPIINWFPPNHSNKCGDFASALDPIWDSGVARIRGSLAVCHFPVVVYSAPTARLDRKIEDSII